MDGMDGERGLSKKTFFYLAERSGLDIDDPHMEDLYIYVSMILPSLKGIDKSDFNVTDTKKGRFYAYVQRILPKLRTLDELDLTGVELAVTFNPSRSENDG